MTSGVIDTLDSAEKDAGSLAQADVAIAPGEKAWKIFALSQAAVGPRDLVGLQQIAMELRENRSAGGDDPAPSGESVPSIRRESDALMTKIRNGGQSPSQCGTHVCHLCLVQFFAEKRRLPFEVELCRAGEVTVSSLKLMRICKALYEGSQLDAAAEAVVAPTGQVRRNDPSQQRRAALMKPLVDRVEGNVVG